MKRTKAYTEKSRPIEKVFTSYERAKTFALKKNDKSGPLGRYFYYIRKRGSNYIVYKGERDHWKL